MQPCVHWSSHRQPAKRILPIAPHRKKAARALHRTAFHATADCAVPPIDLTLKSTKTKMVAFKPNNLECTDGIGPSGESRGMAMRERDR
jgi:hypothetical protein